MRNTWMSQIGRAVGLVFLSGGLEQTSPTIRSTCRQFPFPPPKKKHLRDTFLKIK